MKQIVLLDTRDYDNEEDGWYEVEDQLQYLLEAYVLPMYKDAVHYVFTSVRSSHYGSIGGNGEVGYKLGAKTLYDTIITGSPNADGFALVAEPDETGRFYVLGVKYMDHDGVNHTQIRTLNTQTVGRMQTLNSDVHYEGTRASYDKASAYAHKRPQVRLRTKQLIEDYTPKSKE